MISVIIPNYNGVEYLEPCINALKKQTLSSFEIIIIDNNSSDGSVDLIKDRYENIRLKILDKNYGFSTAVNRGISLSENDYILLLNNDTEVEPHWLENLWMAIKNDEKIFSVSSKMIQYHNRELIDDAGDEYTILGWTLKNGDGKLEGLYNKSNEIFSSCAGAAIYRRKVFDEIGYFDEKFFAYMEDVDISYRARINGYKNVYCSDAVVYHIGSGTTGSRYNEFKVKLSARNNIYVAYKNMPLFQLIINMPFLILGFIIKYLFFLKKGFGKIYLDGIVEGLQTLGKIEKTKFKWKNLKNYIRIEYLLVENTFKYVIEKIKK